MRTISVCGIAVVLLMGSSWACAGTCHSFPAGINPRVERSAHSVVDVTIQYAPEPGLEVLRHGSGFVVSTEGHIVTAAHLLDDFRRVLDKPGMRYDVMFPDCGRYQATLVSSTRNTGFVPDVAVLKLVRTPRVLAPTPIGAAQVISAGTPVFAIGSREGGIIPVPGKIIEPNAFVPGEDANPLVPYIHASTPINVGASGGVLVDSEGKALGLISLCMGSVIGKAGFACTRDAYVVPIGLVMKFARPFISGT